MRRKPITETDKLKEAQSTAKRMSNFIEEELERWEQGNIDRDIMAAGMDTWIKAMREVHRIEHNERMEKVKYQPETKHEKI